MIKDIQAASCNGAHTVYIFWLKSDIEAHSASVDYGAASVIDRLLSAHRIAEYQQKWIQLLSFLAKLI